jgi:chaperone modulatory protein CbpM
MVASFQEIVTEVRVSDGELTAWIEQRWVLPVEDGGRYFFDEADVARVHLIAELRRDLEVNEEAMPVVLRLLDQVYNLRETLDDLNTAIKTLPPKVREQLESRVRDAANARGQAKP